MAKKSSTLHIQIGMNDEEIYSWISKVSKIDKPLIFLTYTDRDYIRLCHIASKTFEKIEYNVIRIF